MFMLFWIAQICGVLGGIMFVMSVQFKRRRLILLWTALAYIMYVAMTVLLGGWSGASINAISLVFVVIGYFYDRKKKKIPKSLNVIFLLVAVATTIYFWTGWFDIVPLTALTFYIAAVDAKQAEKVRALMLVQTAIWCVYNVHLSAWTALVTNGFFVVSDGVALVRYRHKKRKSRKK
jgi:hypothetical protein